MSLGCRNEAASRLGNLQSTVTGIILSLQNTLHVEWNCSK